jgi:hypothetical protein
MAAVPRLRALRTSAPRGGGYDIKNSRDNKHLARSLPNALRPEGEEVAEGRRWGRFNRNCHRSRP